MIAVLLRHNAQSLFAREDIEEVRTVHRVRGNQRVAREIRHRDDLLRNALRDRLFIKCPVRLKAAQHRHHDEDHQHQERAPEDAVT